MALKKKSILLIMAFLIGCDLCACGKEDLSLEELDAYYSGYRSNEWECLVETQEGQSIEVIEHKALQFSEEIEDGGYYIVYSWGSGNSLLKELDIRGH